MARKVNVIEDLNGKKTVFIHDILFKGKRAVNWEEVEKYLRQYVGEFYQIEDCNKMIYIGSDLPDEYTHSNYTRILKGANAKAKANATAKLTEKSRLQELLQFLQEMMKSDRWLQMQWKKYPMTELSQSKSPRQCRQSLTL